MSPHKKDNVDVSRSTAYSSDYEDSSDNNMNGITAMTSAVNLGRSPKHQNGTSATYVLEHLATFTVGLHGVIDHHDALRRLWHLEKTTGIWTQQMELKLDNRHVLILDPEMEVVVEHFPAHAISDPVAFSGNDPKDVYNNILMFTVRQTNQPDSSAATANGLSTKKTNGHANSSSPTNSSVGGGGVSEMHIFQCVSVQAAIIAEDLKLFLAGKYHCTNSSPDKTRPSTSSLRDIPIKLSGGPSSTSSGGSHIPPPPVQPAPIPPGVGNANHVALVGKQLMSQQNRSCRSYGELHSTNNGHAMDGKMASSSLIGAGRPSVVVPPSAGKSYSSSSRDTVDNQQTDDTSSIGSDRYERDVAILNHCFDDIEHFISQLQCAAMAARDLDRRGGRVGAGSSNSVGKGGRKGGKHSGRQSMSDLPPLPKPPSQHDFIDILQKFKLSFNLLAKLKCHIRDPNAPELVHFLFTPLALIVDASRDCNYGANLSTKVVSPLLTREAVDLLINCLTSKESDLWHSLGDSWITPRESWTGFVNSYHPLFSDGWSPDYPCDDSRAEMTARDAASTAQRMRSDDILRAQREAEQRQNLHRGGPPYLGERRSPDRDVRSELSIDSIEHHAQPLHPFPLPPHHIGPEFSSGRLAGPTDRIQAQWLDELMARRLPVVQVTYPRTANNDKELSVFRGEFLQLLDDSRKWWKLRNAKGQIGHVPHTIVALYASERPMSYMQESPNQSTDSSISEDSTIASPSHHGSSGARRSAGNSRIPSPPPPQNTEWLRKEGRLDAESFSSPLPPPPPPKNSGASTPRSQTPVKILKPSSLPLNLGRDSNAVHHFRKKPAIANITESSSRKDVQDWLAARNFSPRTQEALSEVNGLQLFALEKKTLVEYCGREEGLKLDGQLCLQKRESGYTTIRMNRELQEKLAKHRIRADQGEIVIGYGQNQMPSGHVTKTHIGGSTGPVTVSNGATSVEPYSSDNYKRIRTVSNGSNASTPVMDKRNGTRHNGHFGHGDSDESRNNSPTLSRQMSQLFEFLPANEDGDGAGATRHNSVVAVEVHEEKSEANNKSPKASTAGNTLREQLVRQRAKILHEPIDI